MFIGNDPYNDKPTSIMPSPNNSSASISLNLSGNLNIDALLGLSKWGGSVGSGVNLTYSFPWTSNPNPSWASSYIDNGQTLPGYSSANEPTATTRFGFNATEMIATQHALQVWCNVANITMTEVGDTQRNVGDFRFAFSSAVSDAGKWVWGWCSFPDSNASAADIWIAPAYDKFGGWSVYDYNFEHLMHEIGHGLGLKHPGNYNADGSGSDGPYLPANLDSTTYTIMSYNLSKYDFWDTSLQKYILVPHQTPMVYDIQAIQYLYGANNNYHTGNDTYIFDPSKPFYMSIWDAGGIDTIDVSDFKTNCTIDLTPGHYSSLLYNNQGTGSDGTGAYLYDGINNLGIAFGAIIENVTAGSGNDTIIGNSANNIINGGAGNDTIYGGTGIDTIVFNGKEANYTITLFGTGFSTKDNVGSDGSDTVLNAAILQFTDHTLTFARTPDVNLLESYRFYKTAFDRTPDYGGLGYWYNNINHGAAVTSVANSFIGSDEFKKMYGDNPSDSTFVTELYQHAFGRTPDQNGYDFWVNDLKVETRAQVLTHFSESAEIIAKVAGIIANGIIYEAYAA